jgi:GNAT superfamily N-acetyltransferase
MEIMIRRARSEDLRMIEALSKGLFAAEAYRDKWLNHEWSFGKEGEKFFVKRINDPKCLCLVAEKEGVVVGYLAGTVKGAERARTAKRTELDNMFVTDSFRSQGVGKLLVKEFFKWSSEKKVKLALVSAYTSNDRATRFYLREGFKPYSVSLEAEIKS